jgi:hypothetical protein
MQTFFSTDIIKYQNQSGNIVPAGGSDETFYGSFSKIALFRWLQVTLPLSILTLGIGYLFFKIADRKRKREALPFYLPEAKSGFS